MSAPAFTPDPRALSPWPTGTAPVVIDYRPPCAVQRSELWGGAPHGVEPTDVVKSLCRSLAIGPGALEVEPDPAARGRSGDAARCYVLDAAGARVALVTGLSFTWVRVEAARLANHGWRPGMSAEATA